MEDIFQISISLVLASECSEYQQVMVIIVKSLC